MQCVCASVCKPVCVLQVNVMLVGSGGREHSLAWKLAGSPMCDQLFCAPGNPGTEGEAKVTNVKVNVMNHKEVCVSRQEGVVFTTQVNIKVNA